MATSAGHGHGHAPSRSAGGGVPQPHPVMIGAAYYPEYMPTDRLEQDLDLMSAANFTVIRVGESVWSTWEPRNGEFDLDWLEPVLDGAHARGISAIVGTPTYAVPPWLRREYPEVAADQATGRSMPYGARQDVDLSHPELRRLATRVVAKIVDRYAGHPAVIGWQVDNEPGTKMLYNDRVFAGFVEHLRARFGDVQALNESWGLTYWSHRLSVWEDLWRPDGNTTPAYDLAWRRYQADVVDEYIRWQSELVRATCRADQFVTSCMAANVSGMRPATFTRHLDVTALNVYCAAQGALELPEPAPGWQATHPVWMPLGGVWSLYHQLDHGRGFKGEPFIVTETQAGAIGESHINYPSHDGQWRLAIWTMIARGVTLVEYWHWHTLHSGAEAYWGGVLGHGLQPGRCYRELAATAGEVASVSAALDGLVPHSDVLVLVSRDTRWAMQFQPPLAVPGTCEPDGESYARIVDAVRRGLLAAGLQADVVDVDQVEDVIDPLRWPVVLAPALYVLSDRQVEQLLEYVRAGGHLLATFRLGYADERGIPRAEVMPGAFTDAVGASYAEFSNIVGDVEVRLAEPLGRGLRTASGWADGLEVRTAEVLASYTDRHLRRWPAVVTNRFGAGRMTYVGTLPGADLSKDLAGWLRATSLEPDPWQGRPASVTVTHATSPSAGRITFVSNWSREPVTVEFPVALRSLDGDHVVAAGGSRRLAAWDVWVGVEQ